jgi:hypothetical protein
MMHTDATNHQVNAFRLAGIVVIQHELGLFDQDRLAVLGIVVFDGQRRADHLLRRDAVDLLGIQTYEILTEARDNVGLKTIRSQIAQHFQHRLIGEFGVGPLPARAFAVASDFFPSASNSPVVMPVSITRNNLLEVAHRELGYRVVGEASLKATCTTGCRPAP